MKASAALHVAVLATCFAAHYAHAEELDGVRRALETLKPVGVAIVVSDRAATQA